MERFERQLIQIMRSLVLEIEAVLEEADLEPYVQNEFSRALTRILDGHHEAVAAAAHEEFDNDQLEKDQP